MESATQQPPAALTICAKQILKKVRSIVRWKLCIYVVEELNKT